MEKKTSKTKKATNKGIFIALVVAIVILIAVVVGAVVFFQSPERKVANGFANLVNAKSIGINGTITATNENGSYTTTVSAATNKKVAHADVTFDYTAKQGSKLDGKAQAIVAEDGALYAKLDQPKKFMNSFADSFMATSLDSTNGSALSPELRNIVMTNIKNTLSETGSKLENKWIKVTQSDIRAFVGDGEAGTDCYVTFMRKLESDSKARNELANAYKKYQFITIDDNLEQDGSSQGYRVAIDQAKLKEFKDSVADNEAVKLLGSCGQDILTLGASDTLSDQSVDIWIDRFSNNITRIKYDKPDSDGASAVDIKLTYDVDVNVATPEGAVSLQSVMPSLVQPT